MVLGARPPSLSGFWKETGIPQRAVHCQESSACRSLLSTLSWLRVSSVWCSSTTWLLDFFSRSLSLSVLGSIVEQAFGLLPNCVSCFRVFSSWRSCLVWFRLPRLGEAYAGTIIWSSQEVSRWFEVHLQTSVLEVLTISTFST